MQFPVPQFLDIEDKLIGPFSIKQFGFLFTGGLIVVALFRVLKVSIPFFILGLPIALLTLFLSFGKFNGKPIYNAIPLLLKFFTAPKQMVFHKDMEEIETIEIKKPEPVQVAAAPEEEAVQSRLRKLALLLDQKNVEEERIINQSIRK